MAKKGKADFDELAATAKKAAAETISSAEFDYDIKPMLEHLKLRHGYLAIKNADDDSSIDYNDYEVIPVDKEGWAIYNFGNLLVTGPGEYALGTPPDSPKLYGTVVNQGWLTAHKMMKIVQQNAWSEIAISREPGTSVRLNFAAWNAAEDLGISSDYDVLPQDEETRRLIQRAAKLAKNSTGYQRDGG